MAIHSRTGNGKFALKPGVGAAKERARKVWQLCRTDRYLAPIADRAWAETLQHVAGTQRSFRGTKTWNGSSSLSLKNIYRSGCT
jgi:hypothetical protein